MRRPLLLLLPALLLLAAACNATDVVEGIANQALDEEGISIDLDGEDGITIDTPDGQINAGTNADGGLTVEGPDGTLNVEGGEDGQFSITSDEGTITGGAATSLPDDFPALPFPDGIEVESVVTSDGPDGQSWIFAVTAPGSVADVEAFYTSALPGAGFEVVSTFSSADNATFQVQGEATGTIAVSATGDATQIAGQLSN